MAAIGSTGIVRIWFRGQTRLMGHVDALTARQPIFHPEDRARMTIDGQLAEAGWLVQSREQMNLGAGLGVAVREFATASGPVDYALFVGRTLCGVVEAKPEGTTLSGFSDQAARYMGSVPEHLVRREGQVRFEYVASGTEILFRDHADPAPRSRRVFFFHRPETLRRWLADPMTIRRRLQSMPPLLTERLRECQIDAVTSLEASLAADHPRALIQMATGAGKTYTACVFSHRLLEHAKFRRVLFLADRANLVRQTRHEFEDFRPPGTGRSFTELYNVQRLGPAGLDKDASVVIATIQRVYSMLTGRELSEEDEEKSGFETGASEPQRIVRYNPAIPIESFDLIITDECHRSIYGTWRQVLEYFDAFIVGLTATPSLHTMGFFGSNLVAQYPYERSVADGVNVPYEIFRIRTDIGEHGGAIPKGYQVPVRDKRTRAERYEELDQDLAYTAQELDRSVRRAEPDPHRARSLSRQPVHRIVSRPQRGAEDPDLLQGRPPCRGGRRHRPRGLRQGQRLREEDHLQDRRRRPRAADPAIPHRLQPAHRRHRRHDRHRHRREAAGGADLFARREVGALFRADEGARRAHDHADAIAPGDARRRGKDPLRAGRRGRRDREPEARLAAPGPRTEDRLRPAHRRYRRGPARRRRGLDLGGAARRARPQDRRQSARGHRQGGRRPRPESAGAQAARRDRSRHDRARGRRPPGHARSRRRGAEGRGVPSPSTTPRCVGC